ncbi:MAG: MFS transporter [Mycobacteriales bacterium]
MPAAADLTATTQSDGPTSAIGRHPGRALAVIVGAQLMIVLDATIVNIALPKIHTALHFSDAGLSWVINAYTLTFGGLLLLGGRAGDILGRRRVFMAGILLFLLASLVGGFATPPGWLLAARAVQGIGGAIASPTALALIATNFTEGAERNRAFGVFAAVSGAGAAVGLLLGGMLTSWLSWRWVLFVNAPIGLLIVALVPLYLHESERQPGRFDIGGAITSTLGMTALVYGVIHASEKSWGNVWTVGSFAAAVVLLGIFAIIERRHIQPIVPMRLFRNRNRSAGYAVMLVFAGGMMGMFFFLTQFVQNVLQYSPIKAGVAFLPIAGVIGVSAQLSSRFMLRLGSKPFMVTGAALATGGLGWLSQLSAGSGYVRGLLFPMLIFGFGMGFLFVPLTMLAVAGVEPRDSGAASALLNVMQQVGGALGLSVLVTVFSTALKNNGAKHLPPQALLANSISTAFGVAVIFGALGLLLSLLMSNKKANPMAADESDQQPAMAA